MNIPTEIGERVKAISNSEHNRMPDYYPIPGTIGVVKDIFGALISVSWPAGSTDMDGGPWSCPIWSVEVVPDEN